MAFAKVMINGTPLIDLTQDTVTASTLMASETAHDAAGLSIVGEAAGGGSPVFAMDANGYIILNKDGDGGGDSNNEILMRTISGTYENNDITSIGECAFAYCSLLESVEFQNVALIGGNAFNSCSNLTTISFPNASIARASAFYSCVSLVSVYAPKLESIGSAAFGWCTHLVSINLPMLSIISGNAAFNNCLLLSDISFPNLETAQGYNIFNACGQLSYVSFSKLKSAPNSMFAGCSNILSVNMPLVSMLGSAAFSYCIRLASVCFPYVYSIGSGAFYSCFSISTAIFNYSGSSVGSLYSSAFYNCRTLLSLYLLGSSVLQMQNKNVFALTPISNSTASTGGVYGSIFVKASLYDTYISSTNWATYADRIVSLTDAQVSNVISYGTHVM